MHSVYSQNSKQIKQKTNIVFVITDDQGMGDLGATGNPYIETPNIDKLYNQSIYLIVEVSS
ncbi:sulfatase-like hydrolase/transferase [Formosa sp. PL04]|nr:sulfatase-like hydrolase/transferase [Formosa sp. PL04]